MKRLLILSAAALILFSGCKANVNTPEIIAQDTQEMTDAIKAIRENDELTKEQKDGQMLACYEAVYAKHAKDSLGMEVFKKLVTSKLWDLETVEAKYAKASDLIRNDELINTKVEAYRNAGNVLPGMPYINIEGPDPVTGENVSIADVLAQGKPVLVDFWASWCGPCRREIKNNLLPLAAEGKVNVVGIAVWEDSIEDTKDAMVNYGITWPVAYTGGRVDSPSIKYGVSSIPTLFLLAPDGTILASGNSISKFKDQLPE
ncbi:MAG: TlpA family protein disulfide reductase [Bacteroidales bacterium]|nr:TlpA family protein disulfide reductase [Bacteroidales bacterium]